MTRADARVAILRGFLIGLGALWAGSAAGVVTAQTTVPATGGRPDATAGLETFASCKTSFVTLSFCTMVKRF